ncbi:MAG: hypothetical protein RL623_333 [Actinomycetota bacterium]
MKQLVNACELAVGSLSVGLAVACFAHVTLVRWWTRSWIILRLTPSAVQKLASVRSCDSSVSDFLDAIARDVHSGYSLNLAFVQCAKRFPHLSWWTEPIAEHCVQGKSLAIAISEVGSVAKNADFSLAARTLAVASNGGYGIANTLEKCASILRERSQLINERNAQTAQIRLSTSILSWIPLAICVWILLHQPNTRTSLLNSPIGLLCLLCGMVLNVVGRMWMARIARSSS